jgi:hypothetical protein
MAASRRPLVRSRRSRRRWGISLQTGSLGRPWAASPSVTAAVTSSTWSHMSALGMGTLPWALLYRANALAAMGRAHDPATDVGTAPTAVLTGLGGRRRGTGAPRACLLAHASGCRTGADAMTASRLAWRVLGPLGSLLIVIALQVRAHTFEWWLVPAWVLGSLIGWALRRAL